MKILKSIGAVLAGIVVGIALTLATDKVMDLTGVFPPKGQSMVGYDMALLIATILSHYLRRCSQLHRCPTRA